MTSESLKLKKFGVGLLYGAGFAIGFVIVGIILLFAGLSVFSSGGISFSSQRHKEPRVQAEQFAFSNLNSIRTDWGSISVLGTLENKGGDVTRYLNVYADLYDKNGKFIYQCMKQFGDGLRKGEVANMIECHGMPKEISNKYESFKLHVRRT